MGRTRKSAIAADESENKGGETVKITLSVSRETHNRILNALDKVKDYRRKIVYFGQDAIENELKRAESTFILRTETSSQPRETGLLATLGGDTPSSDF